MIIMAIYVDKAGIKAKVRQHDSKWYHLLTDQRDPEELHLFAESIGLKRAYFQPPPFEHLWYHQHYDVTINKRKLAVAKGAIEIDTFDFFDIIYGLDNV